MAYIDQFDQAVESLISGIVAPIQAQLDQANGNLSNAMGQVNNLQTQLAAANSSITQLQQQLATTSQANASENTQIAALNATITDLKNQIASLQAQLAAAPQPVVRASGPTITTYESLPKLADFTSTVNQVPTGNQVSYPAITLSFSDFTIGGVYGALPWVNVSGHRGSGVDKTVFEMVPNSSTSASKVPAQPTTPTLSDVTNPLWLMRVGGAGPNSKGVAQTVTQTLTDFTLLGTPQGHMYNGLVLAYAPNSTVKNVKIKAIPGNNSANPGETFSLSLYHSDGVTIDGLEVDGKDSTGKVIAASAVGVNFVNGLTVKNSNIHDSQFGAGITLYQCQGDIVYDTVKSNGHLVGFNSEQSFGGTLTIKNCDTRGNPWADLIVDSPNASTKVTIVDPVYDGPKYRVTIHSDYWGKPQKQLASDVTLIVNGVARPDLLQIQANNTGE